MTDDKAADRAETPRHALRQALAKERLSAHELSARVSISEKDVAHHLEHLARSLSREGERLVVDPANCEDCGFVFKKRERLSSPSRCPVCKSERIRPPRFGIERRR
jgi:predicted Zn-ribbon and HTH transcriptional regulator